MKKFNTQIRYELCPQMKEYDKMERQWLPHLMFTQIPSYRSDVINTDINGFRHNSKKCFDRNNILINKKKTSLLIGSSSVFGVGASKDIKTISSYLSDNNTEVLNFGGRAYNSFQEIISYISFCDQVKNISSINVFSGVNDYFMFKNSIKNNYVGPLYSENLFYKKMERISFLFKLKKILQFNSTKKKYYPYPETSLEKIIDRNLFFWKKISKGINTNLNFFLQPFIFWCKDQTSEEKQLIDFADKRLALIRSEENYNKLKKIYKMKCEEFEINFVDTNELLNNADNKWLFVDSIHLNDTGYELIAEKIKKWI